MIFILKDPTLLTVGSNMMWIPAGCWAFPCPAVTLVEDTKMPEGHRSSWVLGMQNRLCKS